MEDRVVFVKTPAGVEEVASRERRLPPRLRTLLILVDGALSAAQLRDAGAKLGAPQDCLDLLEAQGLIARSNGLATRPNAAAAASVVSASTADPTTRPEPPPRLPSVAPVDPVQRFLQTKKLMNDTAVDALGLRAFLFTLKLEKCATVADLQAMLPDFGKALSKSLEPAKVQRLLAEFRTRLQ
jgi:hypothetical protein